jgi:tRNA threonylcarbamoyladenosine biosynthesis protein TsaE
VAEAVTSPTFNLLLVHPGRVPLYHFDLYRLDAVEDLDDIGFYETLEADGVAAIEWGDRFPEALPSDHLAIVIHLAEDAKRTIEVVPTGARSEQLAAAWRSACVAEGIAS